MGAALMSSSAAPLRRLAVCVDDFGLKPAINQAAIELAVAGVVTAISCMSEGPAWAEGARALAACADRVDVGLHLNLSEDFSGLGMTRPNGQLAWHSGLGALVLRAYSGLLEKAVIEREIAVQLDAFERHWGRAPDFVDGHQHVHQLPGVRESLLVQLLQRYPQRLPWLRYTGRSGLDRPWSFKPALIEGLGAGSLRRQAIAQGLPQNRSMLGVYGFDADEKGYAILLQRWLEVAQDGDELMCHPAAPAALADLPSPADGIASAREVEYRVLREHGRRLMQQAGVQPVRLSLIH